MQGLDRCFAQGGLYRVVIVYLFFCVRDWFWIFCCNKVVFVNSEGGTNEWASEGFHIYWVKRTSANNLQCGITSG